MRLIADSGSTKTDWCLVKDQEIITRISTLGLNPYVHSDESLEDVISKGLMPALSNLNAINSVEFYGAGCSDAAQVQRIRTVLSKFFTAKISVDHDLLGAAISVCNQKEGIAVILGTGSNSCHFDGEIIIQNVRSLGFILGDEGSGCFMGKKLIQDYLNDELPQEVLVKLEQDFTITPSIVFDKVYKQLLPNRYLASFATWISHNKENEYLRSIIETSFITFFKQHILKYQAHQKLPINVVGSVGFYNKEILDDVAKSFDCAIGNIIKSPIDGLI